MTSSKTRLILVSAWVLALAALPSVSVALDPPEMGLPLELQFQEVQPSVWQRMDPEGRTEELATGPEGLAWAL
ncbi:MAG: hypothetical protein KDD47_05320, partial [Acidobacteria bacterium]|nr:hypothetical protein [Acidobacteriota bacterium]